VKQGDLHESGNGRINGSARAGSLFLAGAGGGIPTGRDEGDEGQEGKNQNKVGCGSQDEERLFSSKPNPVQVHRLHPLHVFLLEFSPAAEFLLPRRFPQVMNTA
jgi:hypothetical protein